MKIGEVIRKHRKLNNLTQEEMAKRLGVTAPAVNKWENGVSMPDIMLLAPLARLFHISLDTLMSFHEELTNQEINNIVSQLDKKLKEETYEETFQWAQGILQQYPSSLGLIWQVAVILDASCLMKGIEKTEQYESFINDCYHRALDSSDEGIRSSAASSLFAFYSRKENYEKAEEYLNYFSKENPERKRRQAVIYSKTGRVVEAYKAYEELLFSSYQILNRILNDLFLMAMEDKDMKKAELLVKKEVALAEAFEMGKYHELSCRLDLATSEKDVDKTIEVMEGMLASVNSICGFTTSALYQHMEFKEVKENFVEELSEKLLQCFKDEETYGYMKNNKRWKSL